MTPYLAVSCSPSASPSFIPRTYKYAIRTRVERRENLSEVSTSPSKPDCVQCVPMVLYRGNQCLAHHVLASSSQSARSTISCLPTFHPLTPGKQLPLQAQPVSIHNPSISLFFPQMSMQPTLTSSLILQITSGTPVSYARWPLLVTPRGPMVWEIRIAQVTTTYWTRKERCREKVADEGNTLCNY